MMDDHYDDTGDHGYPGVKCLCPTCRGSAPDDIRPNAWRRTGHTSPPAGQRYHQDWPEQWGTNSGGVERCTRCHMFHIWPACLDGGLYAPTPLTDDQTRERMTAWLTSTASKGAQS